MHLYLVERTDTHDYDEYDKVLVRADSAESAIAYVAARPSPWDRYDLSDQHYRGFSPDGSNAKATRVVEDGEPGEVMSSFRAG